MSAALNLPSTWLDPRPVQSEGLWGTERGKPQWMLDIIDAGFSPKAGNYEASIRRALMAAMLGPLLKNLQFQNDVQPQALGAMKSAIDILDPKNNQANVDRYRRVANANASKTARAAMTAIRERGGSPDAEATAKLYAQNQATSQTNRYHTQLESPEHLGASANAIMGLMNGNTANMPYFFSGAGGQQYQVPQSNGGLLGSLASLAGMYVGGGGKFK